MALPLACFVVFALLIAGAIAFNTSLAAFFDAASLMFAVGAPAVLLFAVYGLKGYESAILTFLTGPTDERRAEDAVGFLRLAAALALGCGLVGTLIGLVIMLQNMSNVSILGPGMATALLSQFYGVLLAILSYTAAAVIARRADRPEALANTTRQAFPVLAGASAVGVFALLLAFFIMIAAFAVL
jgi:flagellar motor component MotA